jgi:CheY-like chemotaxis protein
MEQQVQHGQKLESLGVLAGGIAHDFNNILMSVLGNADLAQRELSFASPAQANLRDIILSARRAADLCKQMLAYSGKGRFSIEAIDLKSLIEEMGRMIEVSVSKRAALRMELAQGVPLVSGDPAQLRQVVMNLLTNASESLEETSGAVSIVTGAMQCDAAYLATTVLGKGLPEGLYSYVEVADTGCGMNEETVGRMFEPFFSTKFTGRGLGMAAVLGIVRGHGGAIHVTSQPGQGTTVRILFPATEFEFLKEEDARQGSLEEWRPSGTILLVDDEETVRVIGERMLKHIGFDVILAENGLKAIELYQQHTPKIVCIILDLAMPKMDGAETFKELHRQGVGVPVILSSGYDEKNATDRFADEGLAAFIQKPYEVNTLKGVLSKLINPI